MPGPAHRARPFCRLVPCAALLFLGLALCLGGCLDQKPQADALLGEARDAHREGAYLEAEKLYEEYLRQRPQGAARREAWDRLLDTALNIRRDPERAANLLEAMILEYGVRPAEALPLYQQKVDVLVALKRHDQAVDTLYRAIELAGEDLETAARLHERLGHIHQARREYDLAQRAFASCASLTAGPERRAGCLYDQGLTAALMHNNVRAAQLFGEVMVLGEAPEEVRAKATFALADIHEQNERFAEARELLESIRDSYPNPKAVESRLRFLEGR